MNITRQENGVIGGLCEVFFVDLADVAALPDVAGLTALGDVVLRAGATWSRIEGQVYTPHLDGESQTSAAGEAVRLSVEGFWPGDHPDAAEQFAKMQGRQFLLLVREVAGGDCRLAGDQLAGLRFSYKYRSGEKASTGRGWGWSFAGTTRRAALYYAGDFVVEEDGPQSGAGNSGNAGGGSSGGGSTELAVSQLTVPYADAVQLASGGRLRPGVTYRITARPYGRPDVLVDAADPYQLREEAAEFTDGTPTPGFYTLVPDTFTADESVSFVVAITYTDLSNLAGDEQLEPGQLYHVYARPTSAANVLVRAATSYALHSGEQDAQQLPTPTALNPLPDPVPGRYVLPTDRFTPAPVPHVQNTDLGTTLRSFIIQYQSQNQDQGEQVTVLGFGTSEVGIIGAMGLRWQDADNHAVFEWVQTTDYQENGPTQWLPFAAGAGSFAELSGDPRSNTAFDIIISLLEDALATKLSLSGGTLSGDILQGGTPGANAQRLITYAEAVALLGLASANTLCYVATTANHSLSGLANVPQASGSVAITAGRRIAVLFQTNPAQNGLYVAAAGAWSRADDANTALNLSQVLVQVERGTYANRLLASEFDSASVLGTDPVTFNVIGAVGTYLPGTGLQLVGGSTFALIYATAAELATGTDTAKVVTAATLAVEIGRRLAPPAPVALTLNNVSGNPAAGVATVNGGQTAGAQLYRAIVPSLSLNYPTATINALTFAVVTVAIGTAIGAGASVGLKVTNTNASDVWVRLPVTAATAGSGTAAVVPYASADSLYLRLPAGRRMLLRLEHYGDAELDAFYALQ